MVYLACIVSIISMVKAKNKQFQYFSDIFQTFPEYFQFFLHAPDWLIGYSQNSYFSDIFQTFPEHFQFFLHAPDWLSWLLSRGFTRLSRYCPKRIKQCIQYCWSTIVRIFITFFRHSLFEFYSRFHFRHSRNNLHIKLE